MTQRLRLHPGYRLPDKQITEEQIQWLNGLSIADGAATRAPQQRHRTEHTDFIQRQYRGGILTPNGTFTRNDTVIRQGSPKVLEALAAVKGVNVVSGQHDFGMVVLVDHEGTPFDILSCIPLKHQVASMLKARMLTSAEAFQLEPHCPKDEVDEYHPVQEPDLYGEFVEVDEAGTGTLEADHIVSHEAIAPKAGVTWQDEIARLERLINERTMAAGFLEDDVPVLEMIRRINATLQDLKHPKDAALDNPSAFVRFEKDETTFRIVQRVRWRLAEVRWVDYLILAVGVAHLLDLLTR